MQGSPRQTLLTCFKGSGIPLSGVTAFAKGKAMQSACPGNGVSVVSTVGSSQSGKEGSCFGFTAIN